MKNKCPNCGKTDCVPDIAFVWTERYGHEGINKVHPACVHCGKVLDVYLKRSITVEAVDLAPKNTQSDW